MKFSLHPNEVIMVRMSQAIPRSSPAASREAHRSHDETLARRVSDETGLASAEAVPFRQAHAMLLK